MIPGAWGFSGDIEAADSGKFGIQTAHPKKYKYKGVEYSINALSKLSGIDVATLSSRLRNKTGASRHWTIKEAVETPIRNY